MGMTEWEYAYFGLVMLVVTYYAIVLRTATKSSTIPKFKTPFFGDESSSLVLLNAGKSRPIDFVSLSFVLTMHH